jgi:S1-C subfamily serine protease
MFAALLVLFGASLARAQGRAPGGEAQFIHSGAYLGVFLGDLSEARARELKLSEPRGAVVGKVIEESPAAKAGLRENDVILTIRQEPVENAAHFYRLLGAIPPRRTIAISISRDGAIQHLQVTLGERRGPQAGGRRRFFAEADAMADTAERLSKEAEERRAQGDEKGAQELRAQAETMRRDGELRRAAVEQELREGKLSDAPVIPRLSYSPGFKRYQLGLEVLPLNDQLARSFSVSGGGVLVTEIRPGSRSDRSGLKAGDCITAVGDARVASSADLWRAFERAAADSSAISLSIVREGTPMTLTFQTESGDK